MRLMRSILSCLNSRAAWAMIFSWSSGFLAFMRVWVSASKMASGSPPLHSGITLVDHTVVLYANGSPMSNTHGCLLSALPISVVPLPWSETTTSTCARGPIAAAGAGRTAAAGAGRTAATGA